MLRVGLVGLRGAATHDEWLGHVPGFEAAVAVPHPGGTEAGSQDLAQAEPPMPACPVVTELDEAIGKADIVVITEEAPGQEDVLAAALEADRVVLCPPPLAPDVTRSEALLRLAQTRRVETFSHFPWRLHPAFRAARDAVARGRLGTLRVVDIALLDDRLAGPGPHATSWYRTPPAGAGIAQLAGAHLADLLRWLPGREWAPDAAWPQAVLGTAGAAPADIPAQDIPAQDIPAQDIPAQDISAVHLHSQDGDACGRLLMSRVSVGRRSLEVLLLGDRGTLRIMIGLARGDAAWRLSGGGVEEHRQVRAADPNPYPDLARALSGRPAAATFADAVAAQRLVAPMPIPSARHRG